MRAELPDRPDRTVEKARMWLHTVVREPLGATCPCCKQMAKVYRRPITSTMARWLIALVRHHDQEPRYYSVQEDWSLAINKGTGDVAKLRHWGLIRSAPLKSESGARSSGLWRPTILGKRFVKSGATIDSHVELYDSRLLKLSGKQITIRDALGQHFDYDKLMNNYL